MKKIFFIALAAIILVGSCNIIDQQRVKGNGKIVSKTYNLKDFSSIDIGNASAVFLKQDSVFGVKIETDENLFQYIIAAVEEGELDIDEKNDYDLRPSSDIKIYISMPVVKKVAISGASTLKGDNKITQDESFALDISGASNGTLQVKAPTVQMDISGASTLNISGETRDIRGEASGASTIRGYELKAETTNIEASGASTANVFASVQLTANASGASSIKYMGNPKVSSSANGAGSVSKAD
ncbi:head GIN domain-containing protein [Niabella hirudinis]|uniref:head GIN domain-containing protein n=1 Tax=Niabella hirudinis TaxID=1285929 RepID=UPI003EBBECF6